MFISLSSQAYNPGLKYNGVAAAPDKTGCVYVESNGDWVIGNCDYKGAHNACYDGSSWKIAQAVGTVDAAGEPIDGNESAELKSVDSWNPGRADVRCKALFGPSYFFSVPTTPEEDSALDYVLSDELSVQVRRTWLYYFSNHDEVPQSANFWFGNRTAYAKSLIADNADNASVGDEDFSNADCTVMNLDTGFWEDVSCDSNYAFACFESGDWLVPSATGNWRNGYAKCDKGENFQSLYAVPRDDAENNALKAALQVAHTNASEEDKDKYKKVWLNYTDLVFEEFFVANQSRRAWWAESQPTNRRNADCALIDHLGNWIAKSCDKFEAYHACNLLKDDQWILTKSIADFDAKSVWSRGFGYCKRLPNATFSPPKKAGANKALANLLEEGEFAWVNYSDQDNEGAWKEENQYLDFDTIDSLGTGDSKDCGIYSNKTNSKGKWQSSVCFKGVERGFACTNGYEWKITSVKDDLWKKGFDECSKQFGQDYYFAAPSSAHQNARLGIALSLARSTEIWINLNDAEQEGIWVANGPVVNLAPIVELPNKLTFNEKEQITLNVDTSDPEEEGILTHQWSLVSKYFDNEDSLEATPDLTLSGEDSDELTIEAIDLLNKPLYIKLKLVVTDNATKPARTTSILTLKILPPLKAAYDFNTYTNPRLDTTGNGHDLTLNSSDVEIKGHLGSNSDFYANLDSSNSFSIDGSKLQVGEVNKEYTVIYRFIIEEEPETEWSGFMQRGAAGVRQPAMFYRNSTQEIQFTNSVESDSNKNDFSKEKVRIGQWMTVAYVLKGTKVFFYLDKAINKLNDPDSPIDLQGAPDNGLLGFELGANSIGFTSGNWNFGNVPGSGVGIKGGFDDIKIYNRALNQTELNKIFKEQPIGRFEFSKDVFTGDEDEVDGAKNEIKILVNRIEGDDVPLGRTKVSVAFELKSGTAVMGTDFQLKSDVPANVVSGKSILDWEVHDRGAKEIIVELLGDNKREGTESFTIELEALPSEPAVANRNIVQVDIVDKTPNPYGAIAIASSNAPVVEGSNGAVLIERAGTDTKGDYQITYRVEKLSADLPEDFSITEPGFVVDGDSATSLLGIGKLTFEGNPSTTPRPIQTQGIAFTTATDLIKELVEGFSVSITGMFKKRSDGSNIYDVPVDPDNDALLGTNSTYVQAIQDFSPGRLSFSSGDYGSIDEDRAELSKNIILNRVDGDSGALCVNLLVSSITGDIKPTDYEIDYGTASSGSGETNVVYWTDKDPQISKVVTVKAKFDNLIEVDETLEFSWENNADCATVAPTPSLGGDITKANLTIKDVTEDAILEFSKGTYPVPERLTDSSAKSRVTITVNNIGNKVNPFKIQLLRNDNTAIAGTHYQSLTDDDATMLFNAGDDSSEITFDVYDNCDNTGAFNFQVGMLSSASLNAPGLLPHNKIETGFNVAGVSITNVIGKIDVDISASSEGLTNPSPLLAGKYRSTTSAFELAALKLKSTGNKDDDCPLQYSWSYVDATPSLPNGGSLPADFSVAPFISGNLSDSNPFILPFTTKDTTLKYKLVVRHPEVTQPVNIESGIAIGPHWSELRNRDDNEDCARVDGSSIHANQDCNNSDGQKFTYHSSTKQIIVKQASTNTPSCWVPGPRRGTPGLRYYDVRYEACNTNNAQKYTFSTDGDCGDSTYFKIFSGSGREVVEYSGGMRETTRAWSSRCPEREWRWNSRP